MLFVRADNASPLENEKKADHGLTHDRDTALTLIPAAGNDKDFARAVYLLLSQPCFGSRRGGRGGRQGVAKIQRALPAKSHFVERLSQSLQPFASLWPAHA